MYVNLILTHPLTQLSVACWVAFQQLVSQS